MNNTQPSDTLAITATPSPAPDDLAPAPNQHQSQIRIQNSKIPNPAPRRRRSLIARFPKAIRDQINQMLDDGLPYAAIRQRLGDLGTALSDDSIGRWKIGGYQDYLRELRLLDESRLRYEFTLDLARDEPGIDVFQAAHKTAAALICEAVAEIGADSLRQAVKLNPLNLLRMLNSLSRLTTAGLKCERHLADQALQNPNYQQPQPKAKKGISSGSVQEMEDALHLM